MARNNRRKEGDRPKELPITAMGKEGEITGASAAIGREWFFVFGQRSNDRGGGSKATKKKNSRGTWPKRDRDRRAWCIRMFFGEKGKVPRDKPG